MVIVTATISILVITTLVWFLNKVLSRKVCPICAGVAGTWIWMLIGILTNQLSVISYQLLVGILMGGSVVGIAYQLEKRLSAGSAGWRTPLLWKILFIPIGFAAVYSLLFVAGFWSRSCNSGFARGDFFETHSDSFTIRK